MSFDRFSQLKILLTRVNHEEAKDKFILAAFIGWQMGAAGNKTFKEHLRNLGLSDEPPQLTDSRRDEDASIAQKREDKVLSRMGIKAKRVKK